MKELIELEFMEHLPLIKWLNYKEELLLIIYNMGLLKYEYKINFKVEVEKR